MSWPASRGATYGLMALLLAGLAACRADFRPGASASALEITTLAAGTQCGHRASTPAASWLDSADTLRHAYREMTRQSIGAAPLPAATPDFDRYGVLLVSMGQQATAGYQLRLLHPRLENHAAGATVRLEWLSPPPGARTAQVITSPCLLLAVPRGTYRSLIVTDQHGHTRAVADL